MGGMVWLLGFLWDRFVGTDWAAGGAVVIVWAEIVLTRALHLDGLADWADALGGGRDPEARLRIMKDPHLGAFGVVALVCVLLAKWVAWERLFSEGGLIFAVPVFIASRGVLVHLMEGLPSARAGQGMAGPFLRDRVPGRGWVTHVLSLCLCLPFGPAGVGLYAVGFVIAHLLGLSFRRLFGGITGDPPRCDTRAGGDLASPALCVAGGTSAEMRGVGLDTQCQKFRYVFKPTGRGKDRWGFTTETQRSQRSLFFFPSGRRRSGKNNLLRAHLFLFRYLPERKNKIPSVTSVPLAKRVVKFPFFDNRINARTRVVRNTLQKP